MKQIFVLSLLAIIASGCASEVVKQNANNSCAAQGKRAFVFNTQENGIAPFGSAANGLVLCFGPEDVAHFPPPFGADVVSSSAFSGAGIVSVAPGLIADKAGIRANDLVYEVAGRPVGSAKDLAGELNSIPLGSQAAIKLRRSGATGVVVTAQF